MKIDLGQSVGVSESFFFGTVAKNRATPPTNNNIAINMWHFWP